MRQPAGHLPAVAGGVGGIKAIDAAKAVVHGNVGAAQPPGGGPAAEQANDGRYPPFDYRYLRDTVALESRQRADQFEGLIGQWLEQQPAVGDFRQGNQLAAARPDAQLQQLIIELIGHFGAHTRNAVRATAPR